MRCIKLCVDFGILTESCRTYTICLKYLVNVLSFYYSFINNKNSMSIIENSVVGSTFNKTTFYNFISIRSIVSNLVMLRRFD